MVWVESNHIPEYPSVAAIRTAQTLLVFAAVVEELFSNQRSWWHFGPTRFGRIHLTLSGSRWKLIRIVIDKVFGFWVSDIQKLEIRVVPRRSDAFVPGDEGVLFCLGRSLIPEPGILLKDLETQQKLWLSRLFLRTLISRRLQDRLFQISYSGMRLFRYQV